MKQTMSKSVVQFSFGTQAKFLVTKNEQESYAIAKMTARCALYMSVLKGFECA